MFNKIIHGGAATELKRYDDKSIDLTVTSPPYDDIRYYSDGFIAAFDKTIDDFENEKAFKKALSAFKREKVKEKLI